MKKLFIFSALCIFLISCGPSVNPQLKARIDSYSAGTAKANFGNSKKITEPMPFAAGQYVVYRVLEDGIVKSITKFSIIGKEQGGWIFESYMLTESQENIVQMLITGFEKVRKSGNPDNMDIIWIKMKDEKGGINKFEGAMLSFMKGMYKKSIPSVGVNTSATSAGGVITVPAGVFPGTIKIHTKQSVMGSNVETDGWYHTAVPINGVVKSISDDSVMELVKFGTRGAVSELK
jgi:hypothetical protein